MKKCKTAFGTALLLLLLAVTLSACGGGGSNSNSSSTTPKASVANLSVASASQSVTISWDTPATNPPTYNIYFSTDSSKANKKSGSKLPDVTSPYVHTGLTNGTTYYYVITQVVGGVESAESLQISASPQAATPAAPTGLSISSQTLNGICSATLTIPNANSNLKYNVYWSYSGGVTKTISTKITKISNAFTISGTKATFTHNNLLNDGSATYYYIVTAEGDSESDASQQLSVTPGLKKPIDYSVGPPVVHYVYGSPDNVGATVGNQQVTITWNAAASTGIQDPASTTANGVTTTTVSSGPTYNVTWWSDIDPSNKKTVYNLPSSLAGSSAGFIHNSLTNGTTYSYTVAAVNTITVTATDSVTGAVLSTTPTSTVSDTSTTISVVPQAKILAVPSSISAVAGDLQVSLSWAKVSDPSGGTVKYNVYYSNGATGATNATWTKIATTTTNSFTHSGLTSGKTYFYVVTSVSDQSSESAQSSQVSVTL